MTKYVGIGVHAITMLIIAWYLCYVNVLRKRSGYVSRSIKDTTKYMPYLFSPNSNREDGISEKSNKTSTEKNNVLKV